MSKTQGVKSRASEPETAKGGMFYAFALALAAFIAISVVFTPRPALAENDNAESAGGAAKAQTAMQMGAVEITRQSNMPYMTGGIELYSLADAEYGIYATAEDAAADANRIDTITMGEDDEKASGRSKRLAAGEYFLREVKASPGYVPDIEAKSVKIEAGKVVEIELWATPMALDASTLAKRTGAAGAAAQGMATHEGAKVAVMYYDGYYDSSLPDCPTRAWIVKADADGRVSLDYGHLVAGSSFFGVDEGEDAPAVLPLGTVVIQEVEASEGFASAHDAKAKSAKARTLVLKPNAEGTALAVTVDGNEMAGAVELHATEIRGNVRLQAVDADFGTARAQGEGALAGAQLAIVNASDAPVASPQHSDENGTPVMVNPGEAVCTIVTDASGFASTTRADLNGWAVPEGWDGALAYGKYEIVLKQPPYGYAPAQNPLAETEIAENGAWAETGDVALKVARGSVKVRVVDADTGLSADSGSATLAGARFAIVSETEGTIVYGGNTYSKGDVVDVIEVVSAKDGTHEASLGDKTLPFGKYRLVQVKAGKGYTGMQQGSLWSDGFSIEYDGETADYASGENAVMNQVVRANASFTLVGPSGMPLAESAVMITSDTTGEKHVVASDENGRVDTSASIAPRAATTSQGNDEAQAEATPTESSAETDSPTASNDAKSESSQSADKKEPTDATKPGAKTTSVSALAGAWFAGTVKPDAAREPSPASAALPYDTYTVEQIAESGAKAMTFKLSVTQDGNDINLGEVSATKTPRPTLSVVLEADNGSKTIAEGGTHHIVETIDMVNITAGESYQLVSKLHERDAAGKDLGIVVTKEDSSLRAQAEHANHEVAFDVDTSDKAGHSFFVETALVANGETVASNDPSKPGSTVRVPSVKAALMPDENAGELVEKVACRGMEPNSAIIVRTAVYETDEEGAAGNAIVDSKGDVVKKSAIVLTTQAGEGAVERVVADADGTAENVMSTAEVAGAGDTAAITTAASEPVERVSMSTELVGPEETKAVPVDEDVTLADNVTLNGLEKGRKYTLEGELHLIDANGTDRGPIAGATAKAEFTAQGGAETQNLEFAIDTTGYKGCTIECVVTLKSGDAVVMKHEDPEAETVSVPGIATYAVDSSTSSHSGRAWRDGGIVETLEYEGFEPGREYKATVTVKKTQGGTAAGETVNGNGATFKFTPRASAGSETLEIPIDTSSLAGETVYVSTEIACGNTVIATYDKPSDKLQQVSYGKIATWGRDKASDTHTLPAAVDAAAVDTVYYSGLVPGERYTLTATLAIRDEHGDSAGVYRPQTGTAGGAVSFTPTESSGRVDVPVMVDSSALGGIGFTVFEELTVEGKTVAVHDDPRDEDQQLNVASIKTVATDGKSGKHEGDVADEVTLVDTVKYENLTPGKTYKLVGKLMDFEKKEAYKTSEGKEVTATAEITPQDASGETPVQFKFNGSNLNGKTLVVYESLSDDAGHEIATHQIIDSYDQSVTYRTPGSASNMPVTGDMIAKWWWVALIVVAVIAAIAGVVAWRRRY